MSVYEYDSGDDSILDRLIAKASDAPRMERANQGKPRLSYLPSQFLLTVLPLQALAYDVTRVLEFGAKKYSPNNWRKSGPWLEVIDCAMRHYFKLMAGETHDPESGLHHAAHIGCNLAFLIEFVHENTGEDDRYTTKVPPIYEAENGGALRDSFLHLLVFKDGGPRTQLDACIHDLAVYYESLPEEVRNGSPKVS